MVLGEGREFENGEKNSGENREMGKDLDTYKGDVGSIKLSRNLRSGHNTKFSAGKVGRRLTQQVWRSKIAC